MQIFLPNHGNKLLQILIQVTDTNSMGTLWKDLFMEVLDQHAPVKQIRKRSSGAPLINGEIKKLVSDRDKLKRKAMLTKLDIDWDHYKISRNKVNVALRHAKSAYYRSKIASQNNNPKQAWKTNNNLLGRSCNDTVINKLKVNNAYISSPEEIADAFNEYFVKVGSNYISPPEEIADAFNEYFVKVDSNLACSMADSDVTFDQFVNPTQTEMSRFKLVSVDKVFKLLNGLPSTKATGLDKIPSKVLKAAAPTITPSLTHIFNNSILSCCFPSDWKMARLLPVYKNGPRGFPENYRPISILLAVSKLMERIMYDQLYRYFNENSILSKQQFGFRNFHSTASALLDSTNSWYVNMDRKLYNLVVFLDLKKSFDTVNHEILLHKLELYGITGCALAFIQSYLSDRTQICQLGDKMSKRNVKCGIPQGFILGPLLFLTYINDLPECLSQATSRLFADDTNLTVAGEIIREVELAMNDDLARLKEWLLANKLSLNVARTEFMLIGSDYKINNLVTQPKIKIDHTKIKQVYNSRVLGVDIDNKLKWNNHIDTIAKKVFSGIGGVRRIRDFVDRDTLISVYKSLIRPHFDYCSEVWDALGNGLSNRLQKLQNRAARVVLGMSNDTPGFEALGMLGWESLETRRAKGKAVYMYKVLNGLASTSLNDLFVSKSDITEYDQRGSYTSLQLPHPKTEKLKKSFSFSGAKLWNSLPTDLRNADTLSDFKKGLCALKL